MLYPLTLKTYPNQKPWIDGSIRAKLKARTIAFNHGMVSIETKDGDFRRRQRWPPRFAFLGNYAVFCSFICNFLHWYPR